MPPKPKLTPERLIRIRKYLGLSQKEMGAELGLNRKNYAARELGNVPIDKKFTLSLHEAVRRYTLWRMGLDVD